MRLVLMPYGYPYSYYINWQLKDAFKTDIPLQSLESVCRTTGLAVYKTGNCYVYWQWEKWLYWQKHEVWYNFKESAAQILDWLFYIMK